MRLRVLYVEDQEQDVALLTRHFADRLRASPRAAALLNRVAGILLIGFGVKLALSR